MAYLDNAEITIDAILTKKGRQKLARGQSLNITKFALGDDEIDYSLYEPAHPKGSAFYDSAILATPILEANPDESQVLRYHLVTLPKGTSRIFKVTFGVGSVTVAQTGGPTILSPSTTPAGDRNSGYTMILADSRAGTLTPTGVSGGRAVGLATPPFSSTEISATAQVISSIQFKFTPNPNLTSTIQTTLTVYGNETGATETIPLIVTFQD